MYINNGHDQFPRAGVSMEARLQRRYSIGSSQPVVPRNARALTLTLATRRGIQLRDKTRGTIYRAMARPDYFVK